VAKSPSKSFVTLNLVVYDHPDVGRSFVVWEARFPDVQVPKSLIAVVSFGARGIDLLIEDRSFGLPLEHEVDFN